MEYSAPLALLAVTHLLAVMSPGPSFVVVARTSIAVSRGAGAWAAVGMGLGTLVWAAAALFGLNVLFGLVPWLYAGLKIAGGLFLVWLAIQLWRHAAEPLDIGRGRPDGRMPALAALRLGIATQLSNPKVAVFFGSIFLALVPAGAPGWVTAAVLGIVVFNETGWYAAVAAAFSLGRIRRHYLSAKAAMDRLFGGFLGLLGLKLILD